MSVSGRDTQCLCLVEISELFLALEAVPILLLLLKQELQAICRGQGARMRFVTRRNTVLCQYINKSTLASDFSLLSSRHALNQ